MNLLRRVRVALLSLPNKLNLSKRMVSLLLLVGLLLVVCGTISVQAALSKNPPQSGKVPVSTIASKDGDKSTQPKTESPNNEAAQNNQPAAVTEQVPAQATANTNAKSSTPATQKLPVVTLPETRWVPPTSDIPLAITNFALAANGEVCNGGSKLIRYAYSNYYNWPHASGTVQASWEYEVTTGATSSAPLFPAGLNFSVAQGTVQYSDDSGLYGGLFVYPWFGYRVRLHATSPNNIYSSWMEVPQGAANC